MTFIWTPLLWLLILVPLLVLAYVLVLRRRSRNALRFSELSSLQKAIGSGGKIRRHIPPSLMIAGITFLILSVARPAAIITLPAQRGTIVLAMDISGSMRANDVQPSRIAASLSAAKAFVEKQPENVRIGIVAFAGTSNIVQTPSLEKQDVLSAIGRMRTQRGTAIGAGILTSLMAIFEEAEFDLGPQSAQTNGFSRFRRGDGGDARPLGGSTDSSQSALIAPVEPGSYASAVIVLLTDGQTTSGPDPIAAAEQAADYGVRIYTVGLGTIEGVVLGFGGRSMRVQLDEETLRTIAITTDGEYFRAGNEVELERIYSQLSTELIAETEETELTAIFTAFATLLVLASGLLSLLWFRRVF